MATPGMLIGKRWPPESLDPADIYFATPSYNCSPLKTQSGQLACLAVPKAVVSKLAAIGRAWRKLQPNVFSRNGKEVPPRIASCLLGFVWPTLFGFIWGYHRPDTLFVMEHPIKQAI